MKTRILLSIGLILSTSHLHAALPQASKPRLNQLDTPNTGWSLKKKVMIGLPSILLGAAAIEGARGILRRGILHCLSNPQAVIQITTDAAAEATTETTAQATRSGLRVATDVAGDATRYVLRGVLFGIPKQTQTGIAALLRKVALSPHAPLAAMATLVGGAVAGPELKKAAVNAKDLMTPQAAAYVGGLAGVGLGYIATQQALQNPHVAAAYAATAALTAGLSVDTLVRLSQQQDPSKLHINEDELDEDTVGDEQDAEEE